MVECAGGGSFTKTEWHKKNCFMIGMVYCAGKRGKKVIYDGEGGVLFLRDY